MNFHSPQISPSTTVAPNNSLNGNSNNNNNSSSNSSNGSPYRPTRRRRTRPSLRHAPLILPATGERVTRSFTLLDAVLPSSFPSTRPNGHPSSPTSERHPLLAHARRPTTTQFYNRLQQEQSRRHNIHSLSAASSFAELLKDLWSLVVDTVCAPPSVAVLKCSIAYVLGSLATLIPGVSSLLGRNDGKHMVATVVVYFHPARSAGSMIEAIALALLAYAYAFVICMASMGVSVFFGHQNQVWLGHIIVLIVFCGGGLGFLGWIKHRFGNPLMNVGVSLASLAIITVLTKEDAMQAARFSFNKVYQIMKMVFMGILASSLVSFAIKPYSARKELKEDLVKITDHLEMFLTCITRGFLSGSNEDCNNELMEAMQKRYNKLFNSLIKSLREAKFEHLVLGSERIQELEVKLVKCIGIMARDLDGLRSAASTQFALLQQEEEEEPPSMNRSRSMMLRRSTYTTMLESIEEVSESTTPNSETALFGLQPQEMTVTDIFSLFISQLGPPMKSLAFTIKAVLNDLPFGPAPAYDIVFNENFIKNLTAAKDLFISARTEALKALYSQRRLIKLEATETVVEYEEVAASCGYFSSSLQDFAEDTIVYLEVLSDLKLAYEQSSRSWNWLKLWRYWRPAPLPPPSETPRDEESGSFSQQANTQSGNVQHNNSLSQSISQMSLSDRRDSLQHIPYPYIFHAGNKRRQVHKYANNPAWTYRIWRALAPLRREDIKFAIKVGFGAMIFASWSFIPATRPFYAHWRGEWGLVSYMLVCAMTIGASNTTGLERFGGSCLGALLAGLAWTASGEYAVPLGIYGWMVSIGCFYVIVVWGKGPMGRFILLTYNISALYAYSLSLRETDPEGDDEDEGGKRPEIWAIIMHRVIAVFVGCLWGIIVTRLVWPASARKKLKNGVSLLWLRMGLVWKRDPLQMLLDGGFRVPYMDIREEIELRRFLRDLEGLRGAATHEFDLRGPFPDGVYRRILEATGRILGSFHAIQTLIVKDLKASVGEAELLRYTREERLHLASRISHLFSVLASSMKLEYPMNDSLPNIEDARDRFLERLYEYQNTADGVDTNGRDIARKANDEDYELLYAYGLVTGQIADEIEVIGKCIEQLYGLLNEESLKLG